MRVSIIVCTYSEKFLGYLDKAITSLQDQVHENIQIVIVVDGHQELQAGIEKERLENWKSRNMKHEIILTGHDENRGLSFSRNQGISLADGDIIAFFDDDAIADRHWISRLVKLYEDREILSAGGKILPIWESGDPGFIPEECYWLIGATYRGFQEEPGFVRNTFGSNMSFRNEVFKKIGGFEISMGRIGDRLLQGEETELSMRMEAEMGQNVYYDPEAIVHHHVLDSRLNLGWLFRRSFEHGISKSQLRTICKSKGYKLGNDREFLVHILFNGISANIGKPGKMFFLACCVTLVAAGYIRHRIFEK